MTELTNIKNKNITIIIKNYNVLDFLLESFRKAGYEFNNGVLNAVKFGAPQTRERLIIIGVRSDIIANEVGKAKQSMDFKCSSIYSDFVFNSEEVHKHINTSTREVESNKKV